MRSMVGGGGGCRVDGGREEGGVVYGSVCGSV